MAVASERGSSNRATSRGRSSSNGSRSSGKTRAATRSNQNKQSSAPSGQSSRARPQQTRAGSGSSSPRARSGSQSASSRSGSQSASSRRESTAPSTDSKSRQQTGGKRNAVANVGISALSAAAGLAGGVLIGRTALQRNRKVLGIPMPNKIDLNDVTQQIGEAGRQFGKLAGEVRAVREKAEQVGRIIS
jgi:hypothetical protein